MAFAIAWPLAVLTCHCLAWAEARGTSPLKAQVEPLWLCRYGCAVTALPLWLCRSSSAVTVLPFWLCRDGVTVMALATALPLAVLI